MINLQDQLDWYKSHGYSLTSEQIEAVQRRLSIDSYRERDYIEQGLDSTPIYVPKRMKYLDRQRELAEHYIRRGIPFPAPTEDEKEALRLAWREIHQIELDAGLEPTI